MAPADPEATRRFRLRGEVGGVERRYPLASGVVSIGSVRGNDVVLPVRGVSRRHARLSVDDEGVSVEDLDSKNSVLVNGARVRQGRVLPGDELRFGPVALRLEQIAAADAELALALSPAASSPGLPAGDTTAVVAEGGGESESARALSGLAFSEGYVAGRSPGITALYAQMRPLMQGDIPVLVLGETGVGKEYVARILHASSPRKAGPFVAVNCAAVPADLLEAEMFGIGKGVATGVSERQGKFQLAQGGTLFLDEIGDMSLELQAKLLRALQEKEAHPVGGAPVPVDIRVIAATNCDLLQRIEAGRFRRDLYYRIAGYLLQVPPLRERREDVPLLVEAFLGVSARETGKTVRGITVKALAALVEHAWPGNVRELEHEVRRLVYLCPSGEAIDSGMLSEPLQAPAPDLVAEAPAGAASLDLGSHVQHVEARLIGEALARAGGNHTLAAKLLGISRNGLALKMERLGIKD